MKKNQIILYLATSLDGKIADNQGKVDWLERIPNPEKSDFGYAKFIEGIDLIVMGRSTYNQVLSFNVPWPYPNHKSLVLTSHPPKGEHPHVVFVNEQMLSDYLKKEIGNIWCVGGSKTNTWFLKNNMVDTIQMHLMPVAIGTGTSLFSEIICEIPFQLTHHKRYENGVVELIYKKEL